MTRLAMLATQIRGLATVETWSAGQDETRRLPPARDGLVLSVGRGTVVVTQAGHAEDHVLQPGQALRLRGDGLAVAWALEPAELTIVRRGHGDRGGEPHDRPERPAA